MQPALLSPLLSHAGFPHAFLTRQGGVSEAPYDSLNFSLRGDSAEHVRANTVRLAEWVGFDPAHLYQVEQVHGSRAVVAAGDASKWLVEKADALVLFGRGHEKASIGSASVGVRVADCVPVLVGDPESGSCAAIHAGWRGLVAGVISAAITELSRACDPNMLIAAIGPHIGPCCFEVGEDVSTEMVRHYGETVIHRRAGAKAWVDLRAGARSALFQAGLDATRIDDVAGCTRCEGARFFSYRRDGERSGRHLAVIGLRKPGRFALVRP